MRLLTLNLSCENVYYPARKHFEKTNKKTSVTQTLLNKVKWTFLTTHLVPIIWNSCLFSAEVKSTAGLFSCLERRFCPCCWDIL